MIDNSASMADKQNVLARTVPDLLARFTSPLCGTRDAQGIFAPAPAASQPPDGQSPCGAGMVRELQPLLDIHIGVVTSALGDHGSDTCHFRPDGMTAQSNNPTLNDHARLVARTPRPSPTDFSFAQPAVQTYGNLGFLAWDPTQKNDTPPGETSAANLTHQFTTMVIGVDQAGCGYEAQLEGWYRFLVEPNPPDAVNHPRGPSGKVLFSEPATADGTDSTLLKQRADFLRPDSLVAIVSLSDENDCSVIDGTLPADVCNQPTFGPGGVVNGCAKAREAWPEAYHTQLNFNNGAPFPLNWLVAQLALPEKVPYSLPPGISYYHMPPGTSACDVDWGSPDCKSCMNADVVQTDPKCAKAFNPASGPTDDEDPILLRLWETKRRFGVDFLYPLQRYVDGLKNPLVYDRNGFLVPNPLFDDLAYDAVIATGGKPNRPKAAPRPANLIYFASIAGVPWQDIARDPKDLSKGYKPTFGVSPSDPGLDGPIAGLKNADGSPATGWDLILGDPFNPSASQRRDPLDPLMKESNKPRFGNGQPALTHPITGEVLGDSWNSINGNDYRGIKINIPGSTTQDLEYACIFPLPQDLPPKDCKALSMMQLPCDCSDWDPQTSHNPLCATPVDLNDRAVGMFGTYEHMQYRAKAYPGTRYLQVLKGVGPQGIVASICASNLNDPSRGDYGFRPVVQALAERAATHLPH